jgi:hypothetical protein
VTAGERGRGPSGDAPERRDPARSVSTAGSGPADPPPGDGAMPSWESECACPGLCLRDHQTD